MKFNFHVFLFFFLLFFFSCETLRDRTQDSFGPGESISDPDLPQPPDSPSNVSPVANAGADRAVVDIDHNGSQSVRLDGGASYDTDGRIVSYMWREGAAPLATGANPNINLSVGAHSIVLSVTDDKGGISEDTVLVTVTAAPAPPEPTDLRSTSAIHSILLDWTSGGGNSFRFYVAYKLGGVPPNCLGQPGQGEIVRDISVNSATVSSLNANTLYGFRVCAIDSNNPPVISTGVVLTTTTLREPPANQPPTVSAGPNVSSRVGADVRLSGAATDDNLPNPPGRLTLQWSKQSGPGSVTFSNSTAAITEVHADQTGTYVLRLTGSDSVETRFSEVNLTVGPAPPSSPIDQDGDGVTLQDDCDDANPARYLGGIEIPNDNIDQDCSGDDLTFQGRFIYVDAVLGRNTNSGALKSPFATIQFALDGTNSIPRASAGDTIFLRGGIHTGNFIVRRENAGRSGIPLTIKSYPGEWAKIDAANASKGVYIETGADYVTLEKLEIFNAATKLVLMAANYGVLRNVIVHGSRADGVQMHTDGIGAPERHHNLIDGLTMYDVTTEGLFPDTQKFSVIRHVTSTNIGSANIDPGAFRYGLIENSYFRYNRSVSYDGRSRGPLKMRGGDKVYEGNYQTVLRRIVASEPSKYGFLFEDAGATDPSKAGLVVYNNDVISIQTSLESSATQGAISIVLSTEGDGRGIDNLNNIIKNNLVSVRGGKLLSFSRGDASIPWNFIFTHDIDFNFYLRQDNPSIPPADMRNWPSGNGPFPYDVNAVYGQNPQFLNPQQDAAPQGFQLTGTRATNAAIDSGTFLTRTLSAAQNSRIVNVDEASYFTDGYSLIPGDLIVIGTNIPLRVKRVNVETHQIELFSSASWNQGDPVSLPYAGIAPDRGAYESSMSQPSIGHTAPAEANYSGPR